MAIESELIELQGRCISLTKKEIGDEIEDIPGTQAKFFKTEISGSDGKPVT